jgi:hypothetical protein
MNFDSNTFAVVGAIVGIYGFLIAVGVFYARKALKKYRAWQWKRFYAKSRASAFWPDVGSTFTFGTISASEITSGSILSDKLAPVRDSGEAGASSDVYPMH